MKIRETLDWLQSEEPKTGYAAGIKAYADQMLRNHRGQKADMKKMPEGNEDWGAEESEIPVDARRGVDSQEAGY